MNVHAQLRFARRVLKHLDSATPQTKPLEYYGWLNDYRDDLAMWENEHTLVQTTIELVRVEGLHANPGTLPEQAWGEIGSRAGTVRIADRLREFITTHQPRDQDERFVASTEILESSFGKLKRIEGQQNQDGMTSLVLVLGAMVGTCAETDLREALDATPQKKVDRWAGQTLGHSMQWLRRQFITTTKT